MKTVEQQPRSDVQKATDRMITKVILVAAVMSVVAFVSAASIRAQKATKTVVPAIALDAIDADAMKSAPMVAITSDERKMPAAVAIQTMPQAADIVPTIAVLGFVSISVAFGLLLDSQRPRPVFARGRLR
jgi:hypothetical protein